jgi:hypothetical protein
MILKHRLDMSDSEVVQGFHENVVWLVFCGVPLEEFHVMQVPETFGSGRDGEG